MRISRLLEGARSAIHAVVVIGTVGYSRAPDLPSSYIAPGDHIAPYCAADFA